MGYRQTTLERVTQNDKLARFQIRGRHDRFQGNETPIFLNDEVTSSGVDDSHTGANGGEIRQKGNLVQILLGSVTTTRNYHKEDSMVVCNIMSRCIAFGRPIANCYFQSSSITSEHEIFFDNDVNSDLTASSSQ
jgi:hypothetical protein